MRSWACAIFRVQQQEFTNSVCRKRACAKLRNHVARGTRVQPDWNWFRKQPLTGGPRNNSSATEAKYTPLADCQGPSQSGCPSTGSGSDRFAQTSFSLLCGQERALLLS
jgi:hypothetical protein